MIKMVAFDLDGTIADSLPMCMEAFKRAVSPYAGHMLTEEEIIQTYGLNEVGMIKAVVKERWEEALGDFFVEYENLHSQCREPVEGILPLIEMLKDRGIVVVLVTGKGEESCGITLEKLGMTYLFDDIRTGSEYKNCKKDSFLALMDTYHLSKEECVYIGDAVSDVTACREAGIRCLSAAWCSTADRKKLWEINKGNVYQKVEELLPFFDADTRQDA